MAERGATAVIRIDDLGFGGSGVGRLPGGKACFVPGVIAGELAEVLPEKQASRHAEASLVRIVEASPDRVAPPCPYFGTCGGCSYQHIRYPAQLDAKRRQVAEVLKRLGGLADVHVEPVVPSPKPLGYRNRLTVHARGGKIGFHRRGGRGIVDIDRCLLASHDVNARLARFRLRRGVEDGAVTLREHADRFGFHQTNDDVAGLLLEAVDAECGEGGETLIDAYCGSGFFARRLAPKFRRVIGIEWSARSVQAATAGAGPNEEYLEGDVADRLPEVLERVGGGGATVILDPPSQGADERVLGALDKVPVERALYVSCNPSTLARDMRRLSHAYTFARVRPFDMFPQTAEIEVLAVGTRREDG